MKKHSSVFIVPTGIGASIGGFAGDASSYARKIADEISKKTNGKLIVNPNVVNAACFSGINDNMLYTEGFALDLFFKKEIALRIPAQNSNGNSVGIIFDKDIPENILNIHLNTTNAVKTVYGIEDIDYEITKEPVGISFEITKSGISTGSVKNPNTLINSAKNLIKKGSNAIAVVCLFEDAEDETYSSGKGVDPVGGVEAIISHIITKKLLVPCAHAPAFEDVEISTQIINPKAAAEYITPTFLPCILLGLNKAPQLIPYESKIESDLTVDNIKNLIMPYNSLGCIPVLKAIEHNITVLAVKENSTVLNIEAEKLGIENKIKIIEKYSDISELI